MSTLAVSTECEFFLGKHAATHEHSHQSNAMHRTWHAVLARNGGAVRSASRSAWSTLGLQPRSCCQHPARMAGRSILASAPITALIIGLYTLRKSMCIDMHIDSDGPLTQSTLQLYIAASFEGGRGNACAAQQRTGGVPGQAPNVAWCRGGPMWFKGYFHTFCKKNALRSFFRNLISLQYWAAYWLWLRTGSWTNHVTRRRKTPGLFSMQSFLAAQCPPCDL